jgi:hypothetical protein
MDILNKDGRKVHNLDKKNIKKKDDDYLNILPPDFNTREYKLLNSDLKSLTDSQAKLHYCKYAKKECRLYKIVLPHDFNVSEYKKLNIDLRKLSDTEAKYHYHVYGIKERRIYKLEVPDDFDESAYLKLNPDIKKNINIINAKYHYCCYGKYENRKYKIENDYKNNSVIHGNTIPNDKIKFNELINNNNNFFIENVVADNQQNEILVHQKQVKGNLENNNNENFKTIDSIDYNSIISEFGNVFDINNNNNINKSVSGSYSGSSTGSVIKTLKSESGSGSGYWFDYKLPNKSASGSGIEHLAGVHENVCAEAGAMGASSCTTTASGEPNVDFFRDAYIEKMISINDGYGDYILNYKDAIPNKSKLNIKKKNTQTFLNNVNKENKNFCHINLGSNFCKFENLSLLAKYFNVIITFNNNDCFMNLKGKYSFIKVPSIKDNNIIYNAVYHFINDALKINKQKELVQSPTSNINIFFLNDMSFDHLINIINNHYKMDLMTSILNNSDIDVILFERQMDDAFYCKLNMLKNMVDYDLENYKLMDFLINYKYNFLILNNTNYIKEYNIFFNAIYFPQYHQVPENDKFWGEGFTEWSLLKPYDNKITLPNNETYNICKPLNNNYYDLSTIDTLYNQVETAKSFNINGFIVYHYWFKNCNKVLYKPLEYFLSDIITFPFCISWANEHWTRNWDGFYNEVLIEQSYGDIEDWAAHIEYLIPFFKKSNYIRNENDECLFYVYLIDDIYKKSSEHMFSLWSKICFENDIKIKIIPTIGHNKKNNEFIYSSQYSEAFIFQPLYSFTRVNESYMFDLNSIDISKFDIEFYLKNNYDIYEYFCKAENTPKGVECNNSQTISNYKNISQEVYNHFIMVGYFENRIFKYNNKIYGQQKIIKYQDVQKDDVECNKIFHYGIALSWNNCVRRKDNKYTCVTNFDTAQLRKNTINTISKLLINHKFSKKTSKYICINAWNEWNEQAVMEPSNVYGYTILKLFNDIITNL